MGIFSGLVRGVTQSMDESEIKSFLSGDDYSSVGTKAGVAVSERVALSISTIYACVRLISWVLASMPVITYRQLEPSGKEKALNNPIYNLLKKQPNSEMTPFEYAALIRSHQLLWGAGISEIEFDNKMEPVALWPIPPWCVEPMRTKKNVLFYKIYLPDGTFKYLQNYQVIVVKSLSVDSDRWLSPIGLHAENIGFDLAVRDFGALTFGQGTNPAAQINFPAKFPTKMAEESYRNKIAEKYAGLSKSHRVMFTEYGAKFEKIGLPPQDAQYLETTVFNITDFARIYNVPLHLLQVTEKATTFGKGLEEINRAFLIYNLMPYIVQQEQEYDRKLIFEDGVYTKILFDSLLRGNIKDRYLAYNTGRMAGFLSVNEIRDLENMNPLPGDEGNIYLSPLNMVPTAEIEENIQKDNDDDD